MSPIRGGRHPDAGKTVKLPLTGALYVVHADGSFRHREPTVNGRGAKRARVRARRAARGPEIESLRGRERRLARRDFDEAQRQEVAV